MFTWYLILHIVVSLAVSFNCTKSDISPHDRGQKEENAKENRYKKAMKKYRRDNKKMYNSVNKKRAKMEKDLKKCPKESGGLCNIAQRIWEYINFMRSDYRHLLDEEFHHSDLHEEKSQLVMQLIRDSDFHDVSSFDRAEEASGDIYMPKVKEAMALCLKHCEEPEKLQIYVSAHEEKLKYIVECPKWSDPWKNGLRVTCFPLDVNYKNVPPPVEFWKKVEEMKEEDIRENWGGYDEVVKAYQDGYRLHRKNVGNPLTKEKEEEILKRWKEDREKSYAEWKKKDDERREAEEEKMKKWAEERVKKLAEKKRKDGVVAKAGEDKKEKSKVSQSKKIETSKEMSKEKVDKDGKKSTKSKGAETEKNKGSKEGEEKEESDKKDEESKGKGSKMSKESTSKKPSAEEAK